MPRRNNPYVTFVLFLAVLGIAWAGWHFVAVEKIFDRREKPSPPDAEVQRIQNVIEEGLAADPCFDHVAGLGWRPSQQRFRIGIELREGCGNDASKKLAARAQELVDRATDGKHEAEVEILIQNKQVYLSVP